MATHFTESNMQNMLSSRMGWNMDSPECPFRKWLVVLCSDRVAVFLVLNDKTFIVDDELGLYPSDALVTKLRLIVG